MALYSFNASEMDGWKRKMWLSNERAVMNAYNWVNSVESSWRTNDSIKSANR